MPTASRHPDTALAVFLAFQAGLQRLRRPIAHLGYFRDEFVRRRGWLSESSYADLVALCQFLPGPASSQVGMALGLARAGYPAPSPPGSVSPCPRRCCWYSSLSAWDAGARCCPRACCMA